MAMKKFSDAAAGISGLAPAGWGRLGQGEWMRKKDLAWFMQRGLPNTTIQQVRLGFLRQYGLPELKERTVRRITAAFKWDLFHIEVGDKAEEIRIIDAALAQVGKWTYIVVLVCKPTVQADLHTQVFLLALDALEPVYGRAEAGKVAKSLASEYMHAVETHRDFMKSDLGEKKGWVSDQMKGLARPAWQKAYDPSSRLVNLPVPTDAVLKKPDMRKCIADRKSRRKFTDSDLSLGELSYLLWATQGVRMASPAGYHYRTVPSAGSRHSFETYLVIQHVQGLEPGVYRYLPFDNKLVHLFATEDLSGKMTRLASDQPFVGNCAACFIWSTTPYRMEWRYGVDSERVILMDVGHVCQNLYLACESIGCGTCGVAAYEQKALDTFLGLDGRDEFVIYLAPVGRVGADRSDPA
jgi:SagB-type dehydrogenase family enzyme